MSYLENMVNNMIEQGLAEEKDFFNWIESQGWKGIPRMQSNLTTPIFQNKTLYKTMEELKKDYMSEKTTDTFLGDAGTLVLESLTPYLPYNVGAIKGVVRTNITAVSLESPFVFTNHYFGSREKIMTNLSDIRLILRPIGELTKEITIGDKTFTPIIELARIGTNGQTKIGITNSNFNQCFVGKGNGYKDSFFMYNPSTSSFYWQHSKGEYNIQNQYTLFQKLFEWHFDVFNLIQKGTAISVNDIT